MLKNMVIQGLVAALLVGGAAIAYAQTQDNGYLSAPVRTKSESGSADKQFRHGERYHMADERHGSRHGDRQHGDRWHQDRPHGDRQHGGGDD